MMQLLMRRPDLEGLPELPELAPGYVLRAATEADASGLASVLAKAFDDPSWDADRVACELGGDPSVKLTLLIESGGAVVATASVQIQEENFPGSGVLHWVATDPDHRGKRLGWIVSLAVLHEFRRMGRGDAVLWTDDSRIPAIKTYLSLGFDAACVDETHPARWAAIRATLAESKP